MTNKSLGKAVVIGAGVGGLAAVQALSYHFDHVYLIERDAFVEDPEVRLGVPQSFHAHYLQPGGFRALRELFTHFELDLETSGAIFMKPGLDVREEIPNFGPLPRRDIGLKSASLTRLHLETLLGRRVRENKNVTTLYGCRVTRLSSNANGSVDTYYVNKVGENGVVTADFVVDASGRGTHIDMLLTSNGHQSPEETRLGVDIGYSTAMYLVPEEWQSNADWKGFLVRPAIPTSTRGAFLLPIQGDRWLLTLVGAHGDHPPASEHEFAAFIESLKSPALSEAVGRAQRLGEIKRFRFPESTWRHYESLDNRSMAIVPLGDAWCRFNPVYGQGMSVAAMEAVFLYEAFNAAAQAGDILLDAIGNYYARSYALISDVWQMAAIPDLAHPATGGERPHDLSKRLAFNSAILRSAMQDADVHRLMYEVRSLVTPPSCLRALGNDCAHL